MSSKRPVATPSVRAQAMTAQAAATLAEIRRRRREYLFDPRSVIERPALADSCDAATRRLAESYDEAIEALSAATRADTRRAAWALAAAHAAQYASTLADQHARQLARHGSYPGGQHLNARQLDRIEEARASLELAEHAPTPAIAAQHRRRAHELVEAVGIQIPPLLQPGWRALLDRPADPASVVA
ncbi:hypothetical protein [Mycobacterium heckeshornense]|uniref:hypothetical protein n=1 Tax=Mycobacterium heckeshornense TaxID=110505 RepID=UPI00128F716A|nr:hypothetical protein [Mycobacterium heckeshornense]